MYNGIKQNTSSSKSGIIKNNGDNEAVKRNNLGNVQWLGKIILKPTTGEVDEDNSIWYTGDAQWLGYDISGKVWSPRFCVFKNMTYGLRALFLNMNSQILKGNNTIEKLIQVWAPPHENDTKNYIIQVAKNANVNKDTYILNSIIDKRSSNKEVWNNHTVINQLENLKDGDLAIIFDCGTNDFFFDVNNNLHAELLKRGISHDYITRPGVHDGKYWNNSIEYQWHYFCKFFKGYRNNKQ